MSKKRVSKLLPWCGRLESGLSGISHQVFISKASPDQSQGFGRFLQLPGHLPVSHIVSFWTPLLIYLKKAKMPQPFGIITMDFLPAKQFEIRILNTMYDNHVYDLQNYNICQPKKQNHLFSPSRSPIQIPAISSWTSLWQEVTVSTHTIYLCSFCSLVHIILFDFSI